MPEPFPSAASTPNPDPALPRAATLRHASHAAVSGSASRSHSDVGAQYSVQDRTDIFKPADFRHLHAGRSNRAKQPFMILVSPVTNYGVAA